MGLLHKFVHANRGNYAVTFAIVAVPLFMSAGAALDYSRTYGKGSDIHESLDSAVLAGINLTAKEKKAGVNPVDVAESHFAANYPDKLDSVRFWVKTETIDGEKVDVLHGEAKSNEKTSMLALLGIKELPINVSSAAAQRSDRQPICFMAMHDSRKHTLELKDEVTVYAPDCNVYGNSSHPDDVVDPHTPQNFLITKSVQAVGYGHHYLENVTPPLEYAPEVLADPLAGLSIPGPGSCLATNKVISGGKVKLSPGTYCGGLTITNSAKVEFQSGTFVITGKLTIQNSSVKGSDVTLVLSGSNGSLDWNNADASLEAPKTGAMAGMVIVADRVPSENYLVASTVDLHGAIYMVNGVFVWENKGKPKIKADWSSWIIDGVTWTGDGVLPINFKPEKSKIPFPYALKHVVPVAGVSGARLLR